MFALSADLTTLSGAVTSALRTWSSNVQAKLECTQGNRPKLLFGVKYVYPAQRVASQELEHGARTRDQDPIFALGDMAWTMHLLGHSPAVVSYILIVSFLSTTSDMHADSLPVISRLKEVTQVSSTRPERSWERDTSEDSQKRST